MLKPTSQPCLRNQDPIYQKLKLHFKSPGSVLELACGTAQHAVYFSQRMPYLTWQPSDMADAIKSSNIWINEAALNNLKPALELDITKEHWPAGEYNYIYCANLIHFVSAQSVEKIFTGINSHLKQDGIAAIYGPFNNQGFTSEGNKNLDAWLKSDVNPAAGIKELEEIKVMAERHNLRLDKNESMPANNHLLIFKRLLKH